MFTDTTRVCTDLTLESCNFNAPFYANHSVFTDTTRVCTDLTLETLFSIALTKAGDEKMSETGNKLDAVKAEALVACTPGKWSSFMHVLGLASVISNPVRSIYPDVNFRFRSLIHRYVSPRSCPTLDQPCGDQEQLRILWSRDGDFDNRPGAWFEPNHFVPVISQSEGENVNQLPAKQGKTTGSGKKQQGTLFSFVQTKSKSKVGAVISDLRALKIQCLVIKEMPRPPNSVETLNPT